jgi:hypothetical protein
MSQGHEKEPEHKDCEGGHEDVEHRDCCPQGVWMQVYRLDGTDIVEKTLTHLVARMERGRKSLDPTGGADNFRRHDEGNHHERLGGAENGIVPAIDTLGETETLPQHAFRYSQGAFLDHSLSRTEDDLAVGGANSSIGRQRIDDETEDEEDPGRPVGKLLFLFQGIISFGIKGNTRLWRRHSRLNLRADGKGPYPIMPPIDLHFYNADYKLPLTTFYFLGHFCVGKVRFVGYSMKNVHSKSFSLRKVSG